MVLDAGRIVSTANKVSLGGKDLWISSKVEFGRPNELLANEKSLLRALVEESGDREVLYSMAKARLT